MIRAAEDRYGRLDILFNNAGIMHGDDQDAVKTEEAVWDLTMNVNLKGVFLGCKYGIPVLQRAGGGSVINTASSWPSWVPRRLSWPTPRAREACSR